MRPVKQRAKVLLPQPEGPVTNNNSPRCTESDRGASPRLFWG